MAFSTPKELQALKNIIAEVDLLLSTTDQLPQNRTKCSRDLLKTATALVDDLIKQAGMINPAASLGSKGGLTTSRKLGPEHYRKMSEKRKTRAGGRPRKIME